jgi:hypothetical protein
MIKDAELGGLSAKPPEVIGKIVVELLKEPEKSSSTLI